MSAYTIVAVIHAAALIGLAVIRYRIWRDSRKGR